MHRFLFVLLLVAFLCPVARAAEKANTVLLHPGETLYARFEQKGKKLKLVAATKEADSKAQLVLSLSDLQPSNFLTLKIENRFANDLIYAAEMRSLLHDTRASAKVYPVVAGKISMERFPPIVRELALNGFELDL